MKNLPSVWNFSVYLGKMFSYVIGFGVSEGKLTVWILSKTNSIGFTQIYVMVFSLDNHLSGKKHFMTMMKL